MNTYDVVVAGGGVIGASIALELAETGMKVALYDAREPGREASWASAGMISPAPESPEMIVFAPLSLASVGLYPEFIRRVEDLTGMDVGYRYDGALSVSIGGGREGTEHGNRSPAGEWDWTSLTEVRTAKLKWRHDLVANAGMGVPVRRGLRRKRRNSYRKQQRKN